MVTATNGTERTDRLWERDYPDARRQSKEEIEGRGKKRKETKRNETRKANPKATKGRGMSKELEVH
jgi:hypothetical protein